MKMSYSYPGIRLAMFPVYCDKITKKLNKSQINNIGSIINLKCETSEHTRTVLWVFANGLLWLRFVELIFRYKNS